DLLPVTADTEGLDTPHISQSYNWMLSSLALLISNVFLYQTKSSIDSTATEKLNTILAVAEQLGANTNESNSNRPVFVWILRDMQLQMRHDPKSEMCNKLEDVHLRKLRQVFREYDCVPLPRPVDSEASLQEVDQMEFSELKTNFVEEFYILDRLVFKHAMTPPSIGTNQINGAVL
ncbi:hypothetical protein GUITHDRAFT_44019, partial [Guillardia theta CCMP2712]